MTTSLKPFLLGSALVGALLVSGGTPSWAQGKIYYGPNGSTYGSADQPAQLGPSQGNARPQGRADRPDMQGARERRPDDFVERNERFDGRDRREAWRDRDYDRRRSWRDRDDDRWGAYEGRRYDRWGDYASRRYDRW